MNLKKYFSYTFALLLCFGCTTSECTSKQDKGYYTHNPYKLGKIELFIPIRADALTKFATQLNDGMPKWLEGLTPPKEQEQEQEQEQGWKKPDQIWKAFYNKEIKKIIDTFKNKDHTRLLEAYFDQFGNLFQDPTETNKKAAIKAAKALEADAELIKAFNNAIEERYNRPENIRLTDSILEYHAFLYFILKKDMAVPLTELRSVQNHLAQWKTDNNPTGQALWERITTKHTKSIAHVNWYVYPENKRAIEESLKLIDDKLTVKLEEISYKDLLETIPHGIKLIKNTLEAAALEEKGDEDIQNLRAYIRLLQGILPTQ